MWKKEVLILLAIAVGWESYIDRLSSFDSTLLVVLYVIFFIILSSSVILASYVTIGLIRYTYAFIFSIAFIVSNAYVQVMDTPLGYGAFVSLINAAGFMGEAARQFSSEIISSVFGALLLFVGVITSPNKRAIKNVSYSVAPIIASIMLSCVLFFRGGYGAQGLPPMFISLSYMNIYSYEYVMQPTEKRQDVHISREDSSVNHDIVLIVDESVRGDYLDVNSSYGVETGLDNVLENFEVFNFGLAASVSNCSEATNLTLRYGGTRDNYRKIIDTMPSIWSYAKKSGLRTVYIDGQRTNNRLQNGMTTEELLDVDEFKQFDKSAVLDRDIEIAHKLVELINNGIPEFIYINKLGAHFPVHDKYPDSFMRYSPVLARGMFTGITDTGSKDGFLGGGEWERYRNSYKNTLLWNVGKFFSIVLNDSLPNDAVIFYTADHGQDLHERGNPGKSTHCQVEPNIEEGVVPLIIISGKKRKHNDWGPYVLENRNHSSHYNIFPSILNLMLFDKNETLAMYGKSFVGNINDPLTFNTRFNARLGQEPVWKKINFNEVVGP